MSKENQTINEEIKKVRNAKVHTNCFASAALAIDNMHGRGKILDCSTVMQELIKSANQVNNGDITEIEQMLMTQAKALDYMFYDALNKLSNIDMINHFQLFTDIAFRSQTQCRKTLAILAELKNPKRTTFIQQQNNAVNQQINNQSKNYSQENRKVANELLSEANHAALDSKGTSATIQVNTKMETLEPIDRT